MKGWVKPFSLDFDCTRVFVEKLTEIVGLKFSRVPGMFKLGTRLEFLVNNGRPAL